MRWRAALTAYLTAKGLRRTTHPEAVLSTVHSLRLYVYANTWDAVAYRYRPFEPYTTELFEQAVRPGHRVLDLGAQFGYFALLAARRVGPGGRVWAFEPAPANVALLRRNIALNGYSDIIRAVPKAVGERRSWQTLFVYRGSDSHSLHRHPSVALKEAVQVECVSLDEFLAGDGADVIKMDLEGHEPYALLGMRQTLAHSPQLALFAEFAPAYLRRAGIEPRDYLARLAGLGFQMRLIDEAARRLTPITPDFAAPRHPGWHANLYCTAAGSTST